MKIIVMLVTLRCDKSLTLSILGIIAGLLVQTLAESVVTVLLLCRKDRLTNRPWNRTWQL